MSDEEENDLRKMIADVLKAREEARQNPPSQPPGKQRPGTSPQPNKARPPERPSQPDQPPRQQRDPSAERQSQPARAANPPQGQRAPLADPRRAHDNGYRFLNPYNFARYLGKRAAGQVLGDCPPPPHDRSLGLNGVLTCRATAVTPLFISDSHALNEAQTQPKPNGPKKLHRAHRFFEYDGQPALPASSLRGMVRSIFEAATNSCFAAFDADRLSYRYEATRAATLVPARVEANPKGGWQLRLLTGYAPLTPGLRPKVLYAATLNRYDPLRGPRIKAPKIKLGNLQHGARCWALVKHHSLFTYVDAISATAAGLPPKEGGQEVVEGYLCVNNQNIENKRKERFFFTAPGNSAQTAPLPADVAKRYEDLIKDYQKRHADEIVRRRDRGLGLPEPDCEKDPPEGGMSRYMYDPKDLKLQEGALVYASLTGSAAAPRVEFIAPAAVPRVAYLKTVGERLLKHLHPCEEYDALCPACRVFGLVFGAHKDKQADLPKDKVTAYAGRVQFTHGELKHDEGTLGNVTLAILGTPKPTTTRFYLMPKDGGPRDGMEDREIGYDGETQLRGRKIYRHHVPQPQEYVRAGVNGPIKDDQNRTIVGTRRPGNAWEFQVRFTNLAPAELGALLWSLGLQDGLHHRLGYAKPLGFGSVDVRMEALELLDPDARYMGLDAGGGIIDGLERVPGLVQSFKDAMAAQYGKPFESLDNIRDVLTLLGEPPDLPVHYPRTDRRPSVDGKNYEWFMGNKRSGRDAGPRLALKLAPEDEEGLPLLDKYGLYR